jgi:hypothetical protein
VLNFTPNYRAEFCAQLSCKYCAIIKITMKRFFMIRNFILSLLIISAMPHAAIAGEVPKIQIAILLDSSNSMDGLIDQTRQQLWNVVNALTAVRKNGQVPQLQIALYQYGNDSLSQSEGFVQQLTDFTPELDVVSERLFQIRTNGGQEYVGWVLKSALNQLHWSRNPKDFRAIFVAGNEPFNQGQIPWQESVASATDQGTLVNTIYCGQPEDQDRQLWVKGSELAYGVTFNIDQNRPTVFVPSPFDDEITQLNESLNKTYLPFGTEGTQGLQRQLAQDSNAGQQIVTRGVSKSSSYYSNASWDLVDALTHTPLSLKDIPEEDLPPELRGLTLEQKEIYIQNQREKRQQTQARIRTLSAQRQAYLDRLPRPQNQNGVDTVMIEALKKQLARKGFTLNLKP